MRVKQLNLIILIAYETRIQKFTSDGEFITKIDHAIRDMWELNGITIDESGNLYVVENSNHQILSSHPILHKKIT